ncbi:MAG: nuclear transport factor 2 family protein [Gaiellaceae bacterium]
MQTGDAARRWVDAWMRGWRALDTQVIAAVYADECFFLSHPFRDPQAPREYVEWAFAEEEWAEPWFGEPVVDGDRAAVEWRAYVRENGREVTLAGTSLLRFGEDGLCVEQRDAWAVGDGRIERR